MSHGKKHGKGPSRSRQRSQTKRSSQRRQRSQTGRSGALTKQFKKSVKKARVKGIDTRSPETKVKDFEKEAKERAQAGGDGRSQALQKAALQPTIDKNKFLAEQEKRREDILAGKVIPKKSDFTGFEGGIMGIRAGDFTDTGLPKIREGLTSDQYAEYMQELTRRNPALMEKYFPVASGKVFRKIAEAIIPGGTILKNIAKSAFGKAQDVGSGIMGSKIGQDIAAAPKGFFGDLRNMAGNLFGGLGGFLPSGSGQAGLIPAERLYDRESPADRGGVVDAAQSVVDNIYGTRIGVTGPVTADFRDSDGDGIDDRYQTGPGMKYQGPEQGGNLKMPGFTTGPIMMPPHMYPPHMYPPRFAPAMTTDIAASQAAGYDIPYTQQGIAAPNLAQYYQNLNLFPRAV